MCSIVTLLLIEAVNDPLLNTRRLTWVAAPAAAAHAPQASSASIRWASVGACGENLHPWSNCLCLAVVWLLPGCRLGGCLLSV